MRFHAHTLKLLGLAPAISADAVRDLDAAEARMGHPLPASVREWYSLEGACGLLRRFSNQDPPVEVGEFCVDERRARGQAKREVPDCDLVIFRCENQGVCLWAFALDDADDPPVYVEDFNPQVTTLIQCTRTFSEHIYAWMWDWASVLPSQLLVQAQNAPLSQAAISFLEENFEVGPETYGWPGDRQLRFAREDQRLLIWAAKDQADWWLTADCAESLRDLVDKVRHCDDVGNSLWSASAQVESSILGRR